jgi:hypothetical protein
MNMAPESNDLVSGRRAGIRVTTVLLRRALPDGAVRLGLTTVWG